MGTKNHTHLCGPNLIHHMPDRVNCWLWRNRGVVGTNTRQITKISRPVYESAINHHQMTILDIVNGQLCGSKPMWGCTYYSTPLYICIPWTKTVDVLMEVFGNTIDNQFVKINLGTQTIMTLDHHDFGWINPSLELQPLPTLYLPIHPFTFEE